MAAIKGSQALLSCMTSALNDATPGMCMLNDPKWIEGITKQTLTKPQLRELGTVAITAGQKGWFQQFIDGLEYVRTFLERIHCKDEPTSQLVFKAQKIVEEMQCVITILSVITDIKDYLREKVGVMVQANLSRLWECLKFIASLGNDNKLEYKKLDTGSNEDLLKESTEGQNEGAASENEDAKPKSADAGEEEEIAKAMKWVGVALTMVFVGYGMYSKFPKIVELAKDLVASECKRKIIVELYSLLKIMFVA